MGRKKKVLVEVEDSGSVALMEPDFDENIVDFEIAEDDDTELSNIAENLEDYLSDLENKSEAETFDKEISDEEVYSKLEKVEDAPEEFLSEWGISLRDKISSGLVIEQMGYTYHYKPIKDPNNEDTGYFSCHCNPENALIHFPDPKNADNILSKPKFKTNNICLSKKYVIADVEKYVECLKDEVAVSDEYSISSPFYLFWRGKTKIKMPSVFEDSIMQRIFEMFTGVDTKEFDKFKNHVEISVCNRYDGKSSIRLNYVINLKAVDEKGESYNFKDYFTLNLHGFKIPHTYGKFDKIVSNLNSLKEYINTDYQIMSNYVPTDIEIYKISTKLKKGDAKRYRQEWDSIPIDQKNLLISLLMASCYLNKNFNVNSYVELQPIVDGLMFKAFKQWEREHSE